MNNIGLPTWVKVANGSKSFPCPHCGGNTAVGDSRPSHNGIRRRRYCKCGHRFTSYETVAEEFPQDYIQHITNIAVCAEELEGDYPGLDYLGAGSYPVLRQAALVLGVIGGLTGAPKASPHEASVDQVGSQAPKDHDQANDGLGANEHLHGGTPYHVQTGGGAQASVSVVPVGFIAAGEGDEAYVGWWGVKPSPSSAVVCEPMKPKNIPIGNSAKDDQSVCRRAGSQIGYFELSERPIQRSRHKGDAARANGHGCIWHSGRGYQGIFHAKGDYCHIGEVPDLIRGSYSEISDDGLRIRPPSKDMREYIGRRSAIRDGHGIQKDVSAQLGACGGVLPIRDPHEQSSNNQQQKRAGGSNRIPVGIGVSAHATPSDSDGIWRRNEEGGRFIVIVVLSWVLALVCGAIVIVSRRYGGSNWGADQ